MRPCVYSVLYVTFILFCLKLLIGLWHIQLVCISYFMALHPRGLCRAMARWAIPLLFSLFWVSRSRWHGRGRPSRSGVYTGKQYARISLVTAWVSFYGCEGVRFRIYNSRRLCVAFPSSYVWEMFESGCRLDSNSCSLWMFVYVYHCPSLGGCVM